MSIETLSEAILQRDGTSQSEREAAALRPDYIRVEERSLEDWLGFAQQYAAELAFFNANDTYNAPQSTWEGFLINDLAGYKTPDIPDINTAEKRKEHRKKSLKDLLAYIDDPNAFAGDSEKLKNLTRPHLVLFVSFLKLLDFLKEQFNEFTKKHLDFYYYEVLGLTRKGPIPDVANVIIELADDVKELFLPQGTRLLAGKDSLEKDLVYQTEQDTQISRAAIRKIKTLYTGLQTRDLRQIAEDSTTADRNNKLFDMMQLALGTPGPRDPLPQYKGLAVTIDTLKAIRQSGSTKEDADYKISTDYIYGQLFLAPEELTVLVMQGNLNWDEIVQILTAAYRRRKLEQVRKTEKEPVKGFQKMVELALGSPLPPYPPENGDADLDVINNDLNSDGTRERASEYLTNTLFLPVKNFRNSILVRDKYDASFADWLEVYNNILSAQRAQPKEQKVELPEPVRKDWKDGSANPDALATAFTSGNGGDATRCFNSFGKGHTPKERKGTKPMSIGFAITSPRLFLQEGERTIILTLDFKYSATTRSSSFPFSFYLSKAEGWFKVPVPENQIKIIFSPVGSGTGTPESGNTVWQVVAVLQLKETDPPVLSPVLPGDDIPVESIYPVLAVIMDQPSTVQEPEHYILFRDVQLQKVKLDVTARNLKALTLQNDDMVLNYKKPFEPFGFSPETGSRFYFGHPEICNKPLATLTLHFEWLNKPNSLAAYYTGYSLYKNKDDVSPNPGEENLTGSLKLVDTNAEVRITDEVNLFPVNDTPVSIAAQITTNTPAFAYRYKSVSPSDEVINWERYFSLALGSPDFQHKIYPVLLSRQAFNSYQAATTVTPLNPPYTPKLKSFTVDYTSSVEINIGPEISNQEDCLFYIYPFGYRIAEPVKLQAADGKPVSGTTYLLPRFENEGELYIGITGLAAPQTLSLFFQIAEGSASPDIEKPPITWSYLSKNEWLLLQGSNLLFDTTNGLLNTGIIVLNIPAEATCNNTLMDEGLYWLRASVTRNTDAIPDTVAVFTQAVSARFVDYENDPVHFMKPLPPGSIRETAENLPSIDKIVQPYSSLKGKQAETDDHLYIRASERLRHKGRALTMWDYEHMVLEQFPEIYKAKCIPSDDAGAVDLIVIPDIKGKLPFNPFQPKATANVLNDISKYLEQRIPAWATITVRNPTYTQVKVRIAVKIKDGYSEGFFIAKLEEELIRYLAPWAYEEGAEINLDRRIEVDVIINFVAERFYVAYASNITLFSSADGGNFRMGDQLNKGSFLQASKPGEILVSAPEHIIDIIGKEYIPTNYSGIGYMKVELDFRIAEEPDDATPQNNRSNNH